MTDYFDYPSGDTGAVTEDCENCDATGKIIEQDNPEFVIDCPICKGKGYTEISIEEHHQGCIDDKADRDRDDF